MTNIILGIVSLILALSGIILRKSYSYYPLKELRRRARNGDDADAERLFKAATYGRNLRALLWLYIGLFTALSFVLFARSLPVIVSILIIGPILYIVFSLIPARPLSDFNILIVKIFNPFIIFILYYLHPVLDRGSYAVNSRVSPNNHTGLYEREDLIELLKNQLIQKDNRIDKAELEVAIRALQFEDKKVSTILTPANKVKSIMETEKIGPILINEIYQSKNDYVLVKDKPKGIIVGYLAFKDLNIKSSGLIKDIMQTKLAYINENDNLSKALKAHTDTTHNFFVVLSSENEYVGIVTLSQILNELIVNVDAQNKDEHFNREKVSSKYKELKQEESSDKEEAIQPKDEVVE